MPKHSRCESVEKSSNSEFENTKNKTLIYEFNSLTPELKKLKQIMGMSSNQKINLNGTNFKKETINPLVWDENYFGDEN
jgi:hypothetical protein